MYQARNQPEDCLHLIEDGGPLTHEDKYAIGFELALGSGWDGMKEEFQTMVSPSVVRCVLLTSMVVYMGLLAFPEFITKGIAAALGVALAAWLGELRKIAQDLLKPGSKLNKLITGQLP